MANIYVIQPAFTTGEISPAVGSRVDLDQYKSALLNAENTVIRPYGGCCRRQGSKYIGELKSSTQDAILVSFYNSETDAYLLEVGVQYIRIWKDGTYTGIEIGTPYSNPKGLQFSQSGDVMYICSGQYPVKLLRHKQDGWDLIDMEITEPYYDAMLDAVVDNKVTPSGTSGTVTISSQAAIFHNGMEGGYIQLNQQVGSQTLSGSWGEETTTWTSGELYVGENGKSSFTGHTITKSFFRSGKRKAPFGGNIASTHPMTTRTTRNRAVKRRAAICVSSSQSGMMMRQAHRN